MRPHRDGVDDVRCEPMRSGDEPSIRVVIVAAHRAGSAGYYTNDEIDAFARAIINDPFDGLAERAYFHVATLDADVIATAGWVPFETDLARLTLVFVRPDWFGQGIGRRLVTLVETHALASGVAALAVRSSLNAVGFYERLGYVVDRPMPTELGTITIGSTLMRKPQP